MSHPLSRRCKKTQSTIRSHLEPGRGAARRPVPRGKSAAAFFTIAYDYEKMDLDQKFLVSGPRSGALWEGNEDDARWPDRAAIRDALAGDESGDDAVQAPAQTRPRLRTSLAGAQPAAIAHACAAGASRLAGMGEDVTARRARRRTRSDVLSGDDETSEASDCEEVRGRDCERARGSTERRACTLSCARLGLVCGARDCNCSVRSRSGPRAGAEGCSFDTALQGDFDSPTSDSDAFLLRDRAARRAALRARCRETLPPHVGHCLDIAVADDLPRSVDASSPRSFVLCLIWNERACSESAAWRAAWGALASAHPRALFLALKASVASDGWDPIALPALAVYRGGETEAAHVRLHGPTAEGGSGLGRSASREKIELWLIQMGWLSK